MRPVKFHRRATAYLRRMPAKRRDQMLDSIEEVAAMPNIAQHPNIRPMSGNRFGWYRLRVGTYRAVLRPREDNEVEILFIDYIGPRGDAY